MNPNLAPLKSSRKEQAAKIRATRVEARQTFGDARHNLHLHANWLGQNARIMHLADGYLRDRTITQMESPYSRYDNLPQTATITQYALQFFRPQGSEETPEEYAAAQATLKASIEADLTAWRNQIALTQAEREALIRRIKQVA